MKNIIESLNWRYATKQFDTNKKLDPEQLETITEAMRLSASSFGLQPWKFVIVTNPDIRAKLRTAAYGQPQITDASHLIVIAVRTDIDDAYVDMYVKSISDTRGVPVADLKAFGDMLKGSLKTRTPEAILAWSSCQVYIPLGMLLATAAYSEIDACPMEGFDKAQFDEILGLKEQHLESRVLAAVGFRLQGDKAAMQKKVRFPKDQVFIEVK